MPPRPEFTHAGKKCYTIAELSSSNPKNIMTVLEAFGRLCVPIECNADHMVVSGTSLDNISYLYFKICPMKGDSVDHHPAPVAAAAAAAPKKRKLDDDDVEDEDDDDDLPLPPPASDVAEDGLGKSSAARSLTVVAAC
jgi:hypothetical protein